MPDDLFMNSKVGVVTCVMVATAHKPHPPKKQTFFGYWKDDGFVKTKSKGRIDLDNKWNDIKSEWLSGYLNRRVKAGLSVMKEVKAADEWCAEAYMETDYSNLHEQDFVEQLKKYVLFQIQHS